MSFFFRRDKNDVFGTKKDQLGFSERQGFREMDKKSPNKFGKATVPLEKPNRYKFYSAA